VFTLNKKENKRDSSIFLKENIFVFRKSLEKDFDFNLVFNRFEKLFNLFRKKKKN
jgi:hypothetical protein